MLHRPFNGPYVGQPPNGAYLGQYGCAPAPVGQYPDDLGYYGDLIEDDIPDRYCPTCGSEQVGYYGYDEELIGRYCPACESGGVGHVAHSPEEIEALGYLAQLPEDEDMGYYGAYPNTGVGMGAYAQDYEDEMGYYGAYPNTGVGMGAYAQDFEDEMGYYGQPDDDVGHYGQVPEDDIGYYGPYRDATYGRYPRGGVEGYVPDVPPPFNPRGEFGAQLSGYVPGRTVNPNVDIRRTVPVTPLPQVPNIFKPYF